jgi:hypothetical protein
MGIRCSRFLDVEVAERRAIEHHAVVVGVPPERNTIEQGITVQHVIDAIYRSSDAGRGIRLDDATQEAPVELD